MARLTRLCPANIPQHIIQRGNNRQICFANEQDFEAYISWLKIYAKKYDVEVHAWVLMTNHVHLLCTPKKVNAISQMMQSLGAVRTERSGSAVSFQLNEIRADFHRPHPDKEALRYRIKDARIFLEQAGVKP